MVSKKKAKIQRSIQERERLIQTLPQIFQAKKVRSFLYGSVLTKPFLFFILTIKEFKTPFGWDIFTHGIYIWIYI